jgi:hypothetical protein
VASALPRCAHPVLHCHRRLPDLPDHGALSSTHRVEPSSSGPLAGVWKQCCCS